MKAWVRAEQQDDDTVVITLTGEIGVHARAQIPGAIHAAIVRWRPRNILLDVARVPAWGDAVIAAVLAGGEAAACLDVNLIVINASDKLLRQLHACHVADLPCPDSPAAGRSMTHLDAPAEAA